MNQPDPDYMFLSVRSGVIDIADVMNDPARGGSTQQFDIVDILQSLYRMPMYAGHTNMECSVLMHSLAVVRLIEQCDINADTGPLVQLYALTHDFPKAYMGDMPAPVKRLFPEVRKFEQTLRAAIRRSLGVPEPEDVGLANYVIESAGHAARLLERQMWSPHPMHHALSWAPVRLLGPFKAQLTQQRFDELYEQPALGSLVPMFRELLEAARDAARARKMRETLESEKQLSESLRHVVYVPHTEETSHCPGGEFSPFTAPEMRVCPQTGKQCDRRCESSDDRDEPLPGELSEDLHDVLPSLSRAEYE